jgi:hypothetical protein
MFLVQHMIDEKPNPADYLLLRVFRSFLEIDMYASMTVHTEDTIASGRAEVLKFARLLEVSLKPLSLLFRLKFSSRNTLFLLARRPARPGTFQSCTRSPISSTILRRKAQHGTTTQNQMKLSTVP